MKKTIILVLLLYSQNIAQGISIGKYAGEFLAGGVGARAIGMGSAFVALANDGTAGYWNPAGLSEINYPQVILMHANRFSGEVNYDYLSVSLPWNDKNAIGISVIRLGIDRIPDTRNALLDYGFDNLSGTNDEGEGNGILDPGSHERLDISKIRYFSNTDYAFLFSFSKVKNKAISYGANIKLLRRSIGENSALGVGFDVGILYKADSGLRLGANLMDITTTLVAWDNGTKELISPTIKTGLAYMYTIPYFDIIVTPLVDWDIRFENRKYASYLNLGAISCDMHYGLELCIKRRMYIRGGINDIKKFSTGAGISLPKLFIDYSFVSFNGEDGLGNSHRVSLSLIIDKDNK